MWSGMGELHACYIVDVIIIIAAMYAFDHASHAPQLSLATILLAHDPSHHWPTL